MTTNFDVLKGSLLQAKTAAQLNALIIDYTHQEILQVYRQLPLEKQRKIHKIWHGELEFKFIY